MEALLQGVKYKEWNNVADHQVAAGDPLFSVGSHISSSRAAGRTTTEGTEITEQTDNLHFAFCNVGYGASRCPLTTGDQRLATSDV